MFHPRRNALKRLVDGLHLETLPKYTDLSKIIVPLSKELRPLFNHESSVPAESVVRVYSLTNLNIENAFSNAQKLDAIVYEIT